jgi:hypothetical protein
VRCACAHELRERRPPAADRFAAALGQRRGTGESTAARAARRPRSTTPDELRELALERFAVLAPGGRSGPARGGARQPPAHADERWLALVRRARDGRLFTLAAFQTQRAALSALAALSDRGLEGAHLLDLHAEPDACVRPVVRAFSVTGAQSLTVAGAAEAVSLTDAA